MNRLLEVMRRLRAPDGCPWDREQTHASLRPYLLEEAAEAVDALSESDALEVVSELGDVLLQVAFHAVIAEESGEYDYDAIEHAIVEKLIRRHPHVFADVEVTGSAEVLRNWEAIKAVERAGKPERRPAERVPAALGALARAQKVQEALEAAPILSTRDVTDAASLADALEGLVAKSRALGLDAEIILRDRVAARVRAAVAEGG